MPGPLAAVLVALLAVALVWLGVRLARARASRRARARNRVAQRGEQAAVQLLERAGYTVEGRAVVREATLLVDGVAMTFTVRADLVARCRRGRRHVVEVKTGARAPDPRHGPTRRQLLEYALLYGTPHVLLVDMEARAIHEVRFPESAVPGIPDVR